MSLFSYQRAGSAICKKMRGGFDSTDGTDAINGGNKKHTSIHTDKYSTYWNKKTGYYMLPGKLCCCLKHKKVYTWPKKRKANAPDA